MTAARRTPRRNGRVAWVLLASVGLAVALSMPAVATRASLTSPPETGTGSVADDWEWPVQPFRLERPFVAPPHRYGPGHRGVDLRPLASDAVLAPASGIVAFVGRVAGRDVLTIDHGAGLVTTLEPVVSELVPGTPVERGSLVGHVTAGGHVAGGVLHFGVRLDGEYINPLALLGRVPRAVLLPCC